VSDVIEPYINKRLPIELYIDKLSLQPGDILVVTSSLVLDTQQKKELKEKFVNILKERNINNPVVILSHGVEAWVMNASDIAE